MIIIRQAVFSEVDGKSRATETLDRVKGNIKFKVKRAKYRYKDTLDYYGNKEAVEGNRKALESWVKDSKKRSGSNDQRQTIYHRNGMGPESIKDPEKYEFRKEETRRLEEGNQRAAEKALKRHNKEARNPKLAALKAAAKSLKERAYSDQLTEEEKKYKKKVKARKKQKEALNGINTVAALGTGGIIYSTNENAKRKLKHKIEGMQIDHRIRDRNRSYDLANKASDAVEKAIEEHDARFNQRMDEYSRRATELGVSPLDQIRYKWGETQRDIDKVFEFRAENNKKINEARKKWFEDKENSTILAADRLYKKTGKKIDKKTALIGTAAVVPAVGLGVVMRKKRDKKLKEADPSKNKER